LFGRCVNADPAAVLAVLLDFGSRKTLEAAVAAFLLVTSEFGFRAIFLPRSGESNANYELCVDVCGL
jgi:hypothetical protein